MHQQIIIKKVPSFLDFRNRFNATSAGCCIPNRKIIHSDKTWDRLRFIMAREVEELEEEEEEGNDIIRSGRKV